MIHGLTNTTDAAELRQTAEEVRKVANRPRTLDELADALALARALTAQTINAVEYAEETRDMAQGWESWLRRAIRDRLGIEEQ